MPHDVTMPQLGMAQDAGKIVSWLKMPGDAVSKGDPLFEVETDKATMEVEAQADGFLTGVRAEMGEDVPVGQIIARISDSPDEAAQEPAPGNTDQQGNAPEDSLPEGKSVTMPQLGMAQDSGLIVSWQQTPGDLVDSEDVLFEVETDKSTMEVPAGISGYLAATLAMAGEAVSVGATVAIIRAEQPENPVARSVSDSSEAPKQQEALAKEEKAVKAPDATESPTKPAPKQPAPQATGERILASPKARRLALEQGLDLSRLVEAGHPQPFHVSDLETLSKMPQPSAPVGVTAASQRLIAGIDCEGVTEFAAWAAETQGLTDADAILAGLAGACLPDDTAKVIAIERFGSTRSYAVPQQRNLSAVTLTEDSPTILLRDLRVTRLRQVELGADELPVLTLMTTAGAGLSLTLECSPAHLNAQQGIAFLTEFAGRLEQPLRHLL